MRSQPLSAMLRRMFDKPQMIRRLSYLIAISLIALYVADPWLREVDLRYGSAAQDAQAQPAEQGVIQNLSAEELAEVLKKQDKPSLVLMYASWCGYCQQQIPIVEKLKKEYGNKLSVFLISIDQNQAELANYLEAKHNPPFFTPYRMPPSQFSAYQDFFRSFGANFRGGIPYMGAFNRQGEMILEIPGMTEEQSLKSALDEVLKLSGKSL